MGFQFRWWKNFGPFRVNLSRQGATGSVGTSWFRLLFGGNGPRGTV